MAKKLSPKGEIMFLLTMFLFAIPISDFLLGFFGVPGILAALISILLILILALVFYQKILMIDRVFIAILSMRCLKEFVMIVVLVYGLVIVAFATFYYCVDRFYYPTSSYFKWFYFSVITLTTVGYGDVTPINGLMQFLVSLEAFIGYILLPIIFTIGLRLILKDKNGY
ncbi:potassium channel family protein [Dehalobacterium formicoaceticum]|uniref:Potassium channel family protein n=1 Tax=Dehalobacterium formicoaceticum TaxID=51515 RepID=A0ABT1Y1Z5_9FIRM|nr:potassium channel family protein [Dehalobacterium formicoaceticum]MCR6544895.1 potassium channel family protein [Dehalobacterium formicoaceticum]